MDRKTFMALRNVFSNLYPNKKAGRRVAKDAGLNTAFIEFDSAAVDNWEAILTQAESESLNDEKIFSLIQVAFNNGKNHPLLKEVMENGAVVPTAAPVIGEDLKWRAPTDAGTLEKLMNKESTLLPISFLEQGLKCSRSVARIDLPGAYGTGFLTRDNILVTNHHVLENADQARSATVQFNYQNNFAGLSLLSTDFKLDPDNGFATEKEHDWTLVRVKGDANTEWGQIELARVPNYQDVRFVNIIQHPRGGPKHIALYNNSVAYADDNRFQYLTDTLEGSSGSPVFDNKWRVVALHHSGGDIIEPATKKPVFRNEGININRVVEALENF